MIPRSNPGDAARTRGPGQQSRLGRNEHWLHSLDTATGGIRLGEEWTLGALPGRGKTAFGVQVALANACAGTPVAAFSLEMQDTEISKRFLCATSSFAAMQVRNSQTIRGDRWPELMESVASLSQLPIYVDSRPSLKIQELLASAGCTFGATA